MLSCPSPLPMLNGIPQTWDLSRSILMAARKATHALVRARGEGVIEIIMVAAYAILFGTTINNMAESLVLKTGLDWLTGCLKI